MDMKSLLNNAQAMPSTNYDFYKDMSAEDRKALYDQIAAHKASAPSLIAQGAGGAGDAIARSFGHQNTTYAKDISATQDQRGAEALNAMDTQRTQKLQDMNANVDAAGNDPNSPQSQSLIAAAKSMGLNVPSGMPANMLIKVIPGFGELANKQATLAIEKGRADEAHRHNMADEHNTAGALQNQVGKESREVAEKDAAFKLENAKGLQARPWYQKAVETVPAFRSDATTQMQENIGAAPASESTPQITGNGWTIKKKGR